MNYLKRCSKRKNAKGKKCYNQQELNLEKLLKGRIHGKASRAVKLNYGQYGLKAMEPERIIGKQIEAARVSVNEIYEENWKGLDKNISKYSSFKKANRSKDGKRKGFTRILCL